MTYCGKPSLFRHTFETRERHGREFTELTLNEGILPVKKFVRLLAGVLIATSLAGCAAESGYSSAGPYTLYDHAQRLVDGTGGGG